MSVLQTIPQHQIILNELRQQYPDAAFFTPAMIAPLVGLAPRTMRYHCKKYIKRHDGHYRFGPDSQDELVKLLKMVVWVKK